MRNFMLLQEVWDVKHCSEVYTAPVSARASPPITLLFAALFHFCSTMLFNNASKVAHFMIVSEFSSENVCSLLFRIPFTH
jgi:hypothetical protein